MTDDLPPIEYLDEAAKAFGYGAFKQIGSPRWRDQVIAHARALHQLAQARAEIAALKPRETLEDVARREADLIASAEGYDSKTIRKMLTAGFLRGVQMQKEGVLPDA